MCSIAAHTASRFPCDFGEKESKIITKEETFTLARKAKTGDQEALNKIIQANLRFVVTIAKHYQFIRKLEDIVSDGIMGLIMAAQKFDPDRNVKFLTYARWWIQQSILLHIRDDNIIAVPIGSYRKTKIAQKTGIVSDYKYKSVVSSTVRAKQVCSLDQTYSDNSDLCLADVIKSNENVQNKIVQNELEQKRKKWIAESLEVLSERDKDIVIHRFGLNNQTVKTFRELGVKWNLCKERIRQIEAIYVKEMRDAACQQGWIRKKKSEQVTCSIYHIAKLK